MSFVIYDTETTGLDTTFDQILQFAAVRTDEELNVVERFETRCRLLPHVVPDPEALTVTGMSLASIRDPALRSHYEMMREIRMRLEEWSPSTFIGFNSITFDERMLHQAFYQTLHEPALTSLNGNSRADALSLCRAAAFFAPGCLRIPTREDGSASFRLADLSGANSGPVADHTAAADVEAILHLCRTVRDADWECWSRFLRFSSKAAARTLIEEESGFGVITFKGNEPRAVPAALIASGGVDPNLRYCLDLTTDLDALADAPDDAIVTTLGSGHLVRVRINACPAVCPIYELPDAALAGFDETELELRGERVRTDPRLGARLRGVLMAAETPFPEGRHVEQMVYGRRLDEEDMETLRAFHRADWPRRMELVGLIRDPRYRNLGNRLVFIEAEHELPLDRAARVRAAIASRLSAVPGSQPMRSVNDVLQAIEADPQRRHGPLTHQYRMLLTEAELVPGT